jgi:hypothetical protein
MICWPHFCVSFWPTVRDATSLGPPAANPTSKRIGLAGYCCANAAELIVRSAAAHDAERVSHNLILYFPGAQQLLAKRSFAVAAVGLAESYSRDFHSSDKHTRFFLDQRTEKPLSVAD